MEERVKFLKNAILGKQVGAIVRSSEYVINGVLKNLSGKIFHNVVEYGPGDGVLTKELLKLLSPDGKMIVVELNNNFVSILKSINDPRLAVICGEMEDVSLNLNKYGFDKADLVVSSVPFSMIDKEDRNAVVSSTYNSLNVGGRFIIFHQYSPLMVGFLKKYFRNVTVSFELRNFPPCFIMSAKK